MLQLLDIGFISKAYSYGLGKHDTDLTFDQLVNALKWGWLGMIPGTFVAVLARVSSAIFLVRIFGVRIWFKWYLIVFTALQCIGGIFILFITFLGTHPIEALWNPTIKGNRMDPSVSLYAAYIVQCKPMPSSHSLVPTSLLTYSKAIFTFADLTYILFPVLIIWRLQMPYSQRIALILLMCASIVTVAVSIMKTITVQNQSAALTEPQYASGIAALWCGVEQMMVIIMASVPALRAASKIENSIFSQFSLYLSSRFPRSSNKKSPAPKNSYATPGHCHDVEKNIRTLG